MEFQKLQTVIETNEFIKQSGCIAKRDIIEEFISFVSKNPLKGEVIIGTGGARKIRWKTNNNTGKRGGMRAIYYYHDQSMPIFLFTAYSKNQRANISEKEKTILKQIIKQIVTTYKRVKNYE